MRLLRLVFLLCLSAWQAASADIALEAKGGLLTLRARGVPLAELLDRLSHETGMKVTYDGRRPSQLVTVDIERLSEAESVGRIFEGLGLNYALQTDATGQRVEKLIVSETVDPRLPAATSRPPLPKLAIAEPTPEPGLTEESAGAGEDQTPNVQGTNGTFTNEGGERERQAGPIPAPPGSAFLTPGMAPPSFPAPASNPFVFPPSFPRNASNPFAR